MLNSILRFKFALEQMTESKPKEQRTLLSKVVLNGNKQIATYMAFVLLKTKKLFGGCKVYPLPIKDDLPIVSLTSFPARFDNLWMVLYCLYQQTYLPGKIVITLINSEVPGGFDSLPDSLKYFADKGVEFLFEDENLRPHNKYYYCRQKYPNRVLITVDDDLLYVNTTIERLMRSHEEYPEAICANRVLEPTFKNGQLDMYINWRNIFTKQTPQIGHAALGFGGVLYPASFKADGLYDSSLIKELSLGADDLWLMVMELLSNTPVLCTGYYAHPITIPSSQTISLRSINKGTENRNDKYLKKLDDYYHFCEKLKSIFTI